MDLMKQKATDDFMTYATAVIKSRAIPLAEDGLKPVLRRILYTMGEMKLGPTAKTVKSANVVGKCMILHPHGDASIYDAMVRLSQDWKMRYPLTDMQGNNGSLNGDTAAAHRYTEIRLSPAGAAMLEGLDDEIVKFVPNYDESTTEPTMLSGIFPNLLCNGTEGIAVGVSCSLIPHNLNNVVDLLTAHIKNPALTQKEALNLIVGPDFPLGGIVMDGYKLEEIYAKGQGTLTLRAKAEIDTKTNSIIFSEFPYLVDVDRIIKSIQSMVLDEGYTDIVEYENHIGKNSCYIRIICQKKANLTKVLNDLYEQTALQKSVKINNTVIYNGAPVTMSLLGLSNVYTMHRHNCIIKMARKELAKQEHIIHIQSGLLAATAKIDDVVALIRSSESKDEARIKLKSLLGIDSEQADAILALQLGRLTKLDVNDINVKIEKAKKESELQKVIMNDRNVRNDMIIADLEKLRKKFGDARRTVIVNEHPSEEKENDTSTEALVVITDNRDVMMVQESELNEFKKGGKYAKLTPVEWRWNNGLPHYILNSDGSITNEIVDSCFSIFLYDTSKEYIVTISENGIMKKTPMSEYKKLSKLCKVKEGDRILCAVCANLTDSIMVHTDSKINRIAVAEIKESGKLTIGTKACPGPIITAFLATEHFFTLNDVNQMKRTASADIEHNVNLNSGCVTVGPCEKTFALIGNNLELIDWNKVSVKSKNSDGAKYSTKKIVF